MTDGRTISDLYKRHVMPTYSPSVALVKGRGTKVWDADGKVYLDFISGVAVNTLGHAHPAILETLKNQAGVLMHCSNLFYNEQQGRLAEKLSNLGFGAKCFFCNSGAEANEALIKMARIWGQSRGRYEIICMRNSFHGRTLATLTATGQDKVKQGFAPLPEGFVHAEFNSLESVKSLLNEKTVAILVEAIQGEGGVIPATDEFMKGIREICDERHLLMLCDEIQTGMGRTGSWFAFQHSGVMPDAFSLAKGLGGGFPIGAIVAGPKCADAFQPGNHASTFGGNPLACAVANTVIDTIENDGLIEKVRHKGELLGEGLEAFVDQFEHVVAARGRGLMWGLVLDQPAKWVVDRLADIGVLALATAGNVVRILPPLTVTEDELEEAFEIFDDVLTEWHEDLAAAAAGSTGEGAEAAGTPAAKDS